MPYPVSGPRWPITPAGSTPRPTRVPLRAAPLGSSSGSPARPAGSADRSLKAVSRIRDLSPNRRNWSLTAPVRWTVKDLGDGVRSGPGLLFGDDPVGVVGEVGEPAAPRSW